MNNKCSSRLMLAVVLTCCGILSLVNLQQRPACAETAASPVPPESCVTADCHATMGKEKFVHGPVARSECTFCHVPTGKHSFKPITDVGKLCRECHDATTNLPSTHQPVKEGKCGRCHNPHQSPYKFQLRAEGADLCLLCHKRSMVSGKYVHGPTAVGTCSACHAGHQSQYPKLLVAQGNDLCFNCHSDKADMMKSKKFVHAPVKKACISCHNPHSSDYKYTLTAEGSGDLCYTCHKDKQKEISDATVKHKGLETEKKCLACHDPHVSDHPKQLVNAPMDLCLTCHDREYPQASGGRLANMKDLLAKNANHHGPVAEKDCSGCHNTHGSNNFRILRENFPPLFYAGYNPDNYALCFMCHEKTLVSEKLTSTLTGFRNGNQNLHYVHVNKPGNGRTCRACHDAHATNNQRHIRDAVPFGKWKLPVGFTKTETGGQCLPGCHKLYKYDRNKAAQN